MFHKRKSTGNKRKVKENKQKQYFYKTNGTAVS
jgi:hypothetical protein